MTDKQNATRVRHSIDGRVALYFAPTPDLKHAAWVEVALRSGSMYVEVLADDATEGWSELELNQEDGKSSARWATRPRA
jgi:hypothetical protein